MPARLFRLILPVSDIDHAARFYSVILDQPGRRISNGRHYFDCGGVILACFDPQGDGDGYAPTPNPEWLYFAVDHIEKTYDACKTAGASFCEDSVHGAASGDIVTRPWGERSFYVHDPFGNKICFVDAATVYRG